MKRPPRPKYPSDDRNYHEIRRPGFTHTICLLQDLLETYVQLKNALGPKTSHATVVRFLFEAAEPAITSVLQAAEVRMPPDSVDPHVAEEEMFQDPEIELGDVTDNAELYFSDLDEEVIDAIGDPPNSGSLAREAIPNSQQQEQAVTGQRVYTEAKYGFWSRYKENLLRAGDPLVVYVDCRFHSSRWRIESQALEAALALLEQRVLKIAEVIHDDNCQVDAILTQHDIFSSKDLWHKCKNIMGKLKELVQDKRSSPNDCTVEGATTIAQITVFSVQQLKEYCRENRLPQSGSKLQLVQRVAVALKLPEAGASTERQRQKYHELATHDIAYKLKSRIYTWCKNAAVR
ncbi:hypothetical protein R1flu_013275 [Riccia fluitans]|uniref:SAP domain-containing protein n=1 Tax=Riccia fluitans TaxID=41844 RepID=A0ABD1YDX4_9MARC